MMVLFPKVHLAFPVSGAWASSASTDISSYVLSAVDAEEELRGEARRCLHIGGCRIGLRLLLLNKAWHAKDRMAMSLA